MSIAPPRIGDLAPDFTLPSTHGPIKLLTWREDNWVLLLSFPAAFTPVSVTEMIELAAQVRELAEHKVKILGVTPDTPNALLAWVRDLEKRFKVNIPFPLASDTGLQVAGLYGMIHPHASLTAPVRASFVIDTKNALRLVSYYPLANGRSIKELVRICKALQAADQNAAPTPADWAPGAPLLEAPPSTVSAADFETTIENEDFYLRYRKVD